MGFQDLQTVGSVVSVKRRLSRRRGTCGKLQSLLKTLKPVWVKASQFFFNIKPFLSTEWLSPALCPTLCFVEGSESHGIEASLGPRVSQPKSMPGIEIAQDYIYSVSGFG